MTVEQTGVVDWLGIEKGSEHVRLTIVDDLDWVDEHRHLSLLEAKLNTYLAFIESHEVFERLASDLGREVPPTTPIKVTVLAKYDPTPRARAFLEHADAAFAGAGFALVHKVIGTAD